MIGDKSADRQGQSALLGGLESGAGVFGDDRGLKADKFGTHAYTIQLADDSVRLLHTKHIPDAVWAEVEAQRQQIVGGKLKIEPIWDAAKVRALMTSVAAPPK